MTKKHFIIIAKAIREGKNKEEIVQNLSTEFLKLNKNFDMVRFCQAIFAK